MSEQVTGMRIDLNPRPEIPDSGKANSAAARAASAAATESSVREDTATLSPNQQRLQALVAAANSGPEVRAEKVAALSRAVQSGTYKVPAEHIAEAVMAVMQARAA